MFRANHNRACAHDDTAKRNVQLSSFIVILEIQTNKFTLENNLVMKGTRD